MFRRILKVVGIILLVLVVCLLVWKAWQTWATPWLAQLGSEPQQVGEPPAGSLLATNISACIDRYPSIGIWNPPAGATPDPLNLCPGGVWNYGLSGGSGGTGGDYVQPIPVDPGDGNSVIMGKCEWLLKYFPQTTSGVQELGAQLAGVSPQRISTHSYIVCGADKPAVFDGFTILGPNEGYPGSVNLTVTSGGAIDSYDPACGATYTSTPKEVGPGHPDPCDDVWRATSGQVTAERLTYWPWLDGVNNGQPPEASLVVAENPAENQEPESPAAGEPICMTTPEMVASLGATSQGETDQWGGMAVQIVNPVQLPDGWMAETEGGKIAEFGGDRTLTIGYWTIYPPYTCRASLGYKQ